MWGEGHMEITIRLLKEGDIGPIAVSFTEAGNKSKTTSLYERYLDEQEKGERVVLVAFSGEDFIGYVTIHWQSDYPPFAEKGVPEIQDLNVLPRFQRLGIASKLVDEAEKRVYERSSIVGMYASYGPAQRMYVLRDYVPDGLGLFYKDKPIIHGREVPGDGELALYLVKERES